MEVLFYSLAFIGFVLVSGVSTGSFSRSYAESRGSSSSEAYSSTYSSRSNYNSKGSNYEPSKPKCKKNEKEVSCINSVCEYRNCSDIGKPIKCVRLDPTKCIRGCICESEYLRNDTGICIPKDHCPTYQCGINEIYDTCLPICPPPRCDVDEKTVQCLRNPDPGDPACRAGCRCIDNYKQNESGVCIPKEECPVIPTENCGPDEEYVDCANGGCGRWECSQQGQVCVKVGEGGCVGGCRCKAPLLRAEDGSCVPPEQCPVTCNGKNEVVGCQTACPETCDSIGKNCTIIEPKVCKRDCRCKPGFYRNKNGECVSKQECRTECGVNEIYDICPATCPPPRCDVDEKTILCLPNPKPGDPACEPGCRCIDNYKRNENGICIPKEECPTECGINEIYDICPPTCPPQRCDVDERVIRCAKNPEPGDAACKPGCRCIDNYKKNASGICIPKQECPGVVYCGPNEILSSCVNGGCGRWNCSQTSEICYKIADSDCREGCHCIDKYLRADNGTCIPADQCPPTTPPVVCRDDEVYLECANGGCGRWECSQQGQICVDVAEGGCVPGCRCKEPLLRTEDGSCVPADQCPPICTGPNEAVRCRTACPETCSSIGKTCSIIEPAVCIPACRCKPGFYRNADDVCVPEKQCPATPIVCRSDEEYLGCANGGCGRWECAQGGIICIDLIEGGCIGGCRCKKPLLRAEDGSCVPADQCPPICNGQNEVVGCQTACPETCSSIDTNCTIIEAAVCKPACRCKSGFYRNKLGDCISKEQCLQCSGPNEFFSCGSACDNVCSKLSTENQTNCPIVNIVCNQKCYCEENYARDDYNICIPIDECPKGSVNGIKEFNDGNIAFTEKFLRVASKINNEVSAVYSPFSLLFLLAPLGLYTKGNSEQQIFKALNLPSRSLIRSTIPRYLDEFNSQKNVSLDLAARVYVNVQYKLTKAFEQDTKNLFKAKAQNLDFSKPVQSAKTINDWVELKTKNLIKNLVSPDNLSVDTRLVLVNAIYFQGNWQYPFEKERTQEQSFYVNENKNVTVNMMNQIGSFKYAEIKKSNIQVLELPYVNRNLSFVVCLPKSKDGIEDLISTLGDPSFSVLKSAIKSLKYKRVDVSIPSMKATTTTDLRDVLTQLQVTGIFSPKEANLDGILETSQNIFVSSATQKATIIVTETGTEAAAANVIGIRALGFSQAEIFKANHPYVYFIMYEGTPIFCGIYMGT
ncbi:zonadhesin-like isoform X2 [Vanessa atalanta]|uniref:zonadhesin-like isoform X2 n=1 Tax=Vanessa atalanta TaxID=42275 RepID=UPI001FCE2B24|nr:zonadhesin-like isoform X2 [Vanessa atalanta]